MKKVVLSENIKKIARYCFYGCETLEEIDLSNIKEFDPACFEGCASLLELQLSSAETIWGGCFSDCTNLQKVVLSNSINRIGNNAFSGCYSLSDINLSGDIDYLGGNAFLNCKQLKRISFNSVGKIGAGAFSGSGLETFSVTYPITFSDAYYDSHIHYDEYSMITHNGFMIFENTPYLSKTIKKYGLCQYCGGKFTGIFVQKCSRCNRPKDY